MAKAHKKKTVKVTLTDICSNRSLGFCVKVSKLELGYIYNWDWFSPYQRKKAEIFFGKENAYNAHIDIDCGKTYKKKTAKVRLTDTYSHQSLTFRVKVSRIDLETSKWDWLSDGQRKKAEAFFGKDARYITWKDVSY